LGLAWSIPILCSQREQSSHINVAPSYNEPVCIIDPRCFTVEIYQGQLPTEPSHTAKLQSNPASTSPTEPCNESGMLL
ncbi:hypothetical protein WMY93_013724, partial [Mugilogobius chulae]